jgi:hypothetical protein
MKNHNLLTPSITIAKRLLADNADPLSTLHDVLTPGRIHAILQLIEHAEQTPITRDPRPSRKASALVRSSALRDSS